MTNSLKDTRSAVLSLIEKDSLITISTISDKLNINRSAVQKHIETLKDAEMLKREGGRFGGKWVVVR